MKKAIVLGCGLVGRAIAEDLAADAALNVTVADVSEANLARTRADLRLQRMQADLSSAEGVARAIAPFDLVVGALPSALGLMALRVVIESRKPYADISFMAEDATSLSGLARERGVTAVVDCGVAPGLANILIGQAAARLARVTDAVYYVGGLPRTRSWPYEYKAPFAPLDVLEEYTRPARFIENGSMVTRPALSEPELMDFEPVGTLEAFNTDGLRSLLTTIPADNMKEKTLRYPGHAALMRVLRETGYFSKDEITLKNGAKVRPIDVTSRLLFPLWELKPGEPEFTLLHVRVSGRDATGAAVRYVHHLFDQNDAATGHSSMARTTGYPCALVARMILEGRISEPGIHPPEVLGRDEALVGDLLRRLATRGVRVESRVEAVA
ncbi:MAG: saccharopine reductase [Phycisphaerae bacterium]|nr:MAG: saccharopine dehydrogenase NADP-binding domain-containing protein [Planctomycetia bacterium]RIK69773.1 MAG: saccharopine dehydrogenase [Planctomycetota bacterium]GJQ26122.1 MAG: saccharopine reductase [Phycisphaerae bacterium]